MEVAVCVDGSEFEDGFGALESPAGAGDVHPVFDEVSAGAFDDTGRDRPAVLERGGVVELSAFAAEVGGAQVGAGALVGGELRGGRRAPNRGGCLGGCAVEDLFRVGSDPLFG